MKSTTTYSEQELVVLLKQRRQAAFGYLYDNYAAALNGVIFNIIQDENNALDILQEVFVKIWRQIEQYDPAKGRLFTWMFSIARSTSIDFVRSKGWQNSQRNDELSEETTLLADQPPVTDTMELRKAVQALKEEHKTLIELSYFQGYTQEEISKMINIPLGTVKTRMRAAIMQLKKQISI